jgi:hypothetical protein
MWRDRLRWARREALAYRVVSRIMQCLLPPELSRTLARLVHDAGVAHHRNAVYAQKVGEAEREADRSARFTLMRMINRPTEYALDYRAGCRNMAEASATVAARYYAWTCRVSPDRFEMVSDATFAQIGNVAADRVMAAWSE